MNGFDRLDPVVQHHVVNTLGWSALRPLQEESVPPILGGDDALLLAPTAGGKTEAAIFPLLTRMSREGWQGTSVLYVCPLKALLNNLGPRLNEYASWLGRTCAVRHGDVGAGARRRIVVEQPDVLLTTPESIEAMLVSSLTDPRAVFGNVRAVVVDEVHAFAGDDRGWHLLAALERVAAIAGRPLQRIGCSATVGNAPDLLAWLQGSNRARGIGASVVSPESAATGAPDVGLDYVGSITNAAIVTSRLYQGEKRLVFTDSRKAVEAMAVELRRQGTETYVSHSSLSLDLRRRTEAAFAEARDCVIVSTSTLELGIDVGDLDRMLQLGAPRTVASFLQRLGRTGRRPSTSRNALFLGTRDDEFLRACGLLLLWGEGFVEPVTPPPVPLHIVAQQILGLALQEHKIARDDAWAVIEPLGMASVREYREVLTHLIAGGYLDTDGDLLFVGPEAERRYGRRNFLELMAVFTAAPEVMVLHGREEIGSVDPLALTLKVEGPRAVTLAGRSWLVTAVDWKRRRAYVEPTDRRGRVQWSSTPVALGPMLCDAIRRVLLGEDPGGTVLTARARDRLAELRDEYAPRVDRRHTMVVADASRTRWWTWAGLRLNATYVAALDAVAPDLLDETTAFDNFQIALRGDAGPYEVHTAMRRARECFGTELEGISPAVDERAVRGLKFNELLPDDLARAVLIGR